MSTSAQRPSAGTRALPAATGVNGSRLVVQQRIMLRGLGFFDEIHDVTGQAPNGIELHPVTRVRF